MAEVYAGFLSHADHEIGRLLDYLEETGELDNTLIVLVSDNGASGEGGPSGSVNENKIFNGLPDPIEENLPFLDVLGSPLTYNHYPTGWACAFNTPFKLWKRYSNWEGGTADPMIVSWPKRITKTGIRRQYTHAVDIVPTIYESLGIEPPEVVKGYTQFPIEGISFAATFDDAGAKTGKQTQFYSMGGTRAIWHQGWKAAAVSPSAPDMWADYARQRWELFDTENDPSECHDLAAEQPEKLQELIGLWWREAGRYGALPLENRGVGRDPHHRAAAALEAAQPLRLLPGRLRDPGVGGAEHPQPLLHDRGRGDDRHRGGRRRAVRPGLALRRPRALHQGRQAQVRLQLRRARTSRSSSRTGRSRPGHHVFSASFEREGDGMPAEGTLTLHIGDDQVGEGRIRTQPGKFSIAGEGLNVGRDGGEPVTDDYPGDAPGRSSAARSLKAVDRRQRRAVRRSRPEAKDGVRPRLRMGDSWRVERRRREGGDRRLRRAGDDGGRRRTTCRPPSGSRCSTTTARSGARSRCRSSSASSSSAWPRWPRPTRRCGKAAVEGRVRARPRLARRGGDQALRRRRHAT